MATAPYVRNACAMLFRRDLGRSGSALACNILAGRPKGTHMAVVPRRANARQPPPPHAAQSVRAGVPWAGRWQGVHWPSPACVRTSAACCHMPAQHTRTAPGTAVPTSCTTWHRPPRTVDARVCPAQACPESPAPCAMRPTHLCPPPVSQRLTGGHRTSRARSSRRSCSRWLAEPSCRAPASRRPPPPASQLPRARSRVG